MLTRREFAKHLALIAAGAAALPQQIAAYERLYEVNMPEVEIGLVSIDDLVCGFNGEPGDVTYWIELLEGERTLIGLSLNRRATFRYVCSPQTPLLADGSKVHWRVTRKSGCDPKTDRDPVEDFYGTIRWIDQNMRIHNDQMSGATGRLVR